ncbi:hypothetical protein FEM48_Zijuj11G0008800 [Ziziphus jujuba var. spinosa]|nr:hypothetical protein FEM48_Zijuj11G0008800 [Ziziphus jujuba var. spinosa]
MIPHQIKIFILLCLLILSFSGRVDSFKNGVEPIDNPSGHEVMNIIQIKGRKLIKVEAMLDYQQPGPNPTHEPRKGKGGGNP